MIKPNLRSTTSHY